MIPLDVGVEALPNVFYTLSCITSLNSRRFKFLSTASLEPYPLPTLVRVPPHRPLTTRESVFPEEKDFTNRVSVLCLSYIYGGIEKVPWAPMGRRFLIGSTIYLDFKRVFKRGPLTTNHYRPDYFKK